VKAWYELRDRSSLYILSSSNIYGRLVRISTVDVCVTCLPCCRYNVTDELKRAVAKA
jgi:hypothetical protein